MLFRGAFVGAHISAPIWLGPRYWIEVCRGVRKCARRPEPDWSNTRTSPGRLTPTPTGHWAIVLDLILCRGVRKCARRPEPDWSNTRISPGRLTPTPTGHWAIVLDLILCRGVRKCAHRDGQRYWIEVCRGAHQCARRPEPDRFNVWLKPGQACCPNRATDHKSRQGRR